MTKKDLVNVIAENAYISKKSAEAALNAFMAAVTTELQNGEKIVLPGFGSFEVRERAERTGINPLTKEAITIPASKVPAFKPGKALKEAVNK